MASLKAIRQAYLEQEKLIQDDLKISLEQQDNALSALTGIAGLIGDKKKEKKEQKETDKFAEKQGFEKNEKTGNYYVIDPDNPGGAVAEVDANYMKSLRKNPGLYEDSPMELIYHKDADDQGNKVVRNQFKMDDVEVKKSGVMGALQRLLPGGETGYETFTPGMAKGASQTYQDWATGEGDYKDQGPALVQMLPDFAKEKFDPDSIGLSTTKPKDTRFDRFEHNRKWMASDAATRYSSGVNPNAFQRDARFGERDYSQTIQKDGSNAGPNWDRLVRDLNNAGLNVTKEGLQVMAKDISIERHGSTKAKDLLALDLSKKEIKDLKDSDSINAVANVLRDVHNKESYTGDLSAQQFYDQATLKVAPPPPTKPIVPIDDDEIPERLKEVDDAWFDLRGKKAKEWFDEESFKDAPSKPSLRPEEIIDFDKMVEGSEYGDKFKESEYYTGREGVEHRDKKIKDIPASTNAHRKKQMKEEIEQDFKDVHGDLKMDDIKALRAFEDEQEAIKIQEAKDAEWKKTQEAIEKSKEREEIRNYEADPEAIKKMDELSKDLYDESKLSGESKDGFSFSDIIGKGLEWGETLIDHLGNIFKPKGEDVLYGPMTEADYHQKALDLSFIMPKKKEKAEQWDPLGTYFLGDAATAAFTKKEKPHYNLADSSEIAGPEDDKLFAMINGELSLVTADEHAFIQEYGKEGADLIYQTAKQRAIDMGINVDDPKQWPIRDKDGKPGYFFAETMAAVQWIGGAFSKAKAARKQIKNIETNLLPSLDKAGKETSEQAIDMAEQFQEEKDMLLDNAQNQFGEQAVDASEAEDEAIKSTKGLKVGKAEEFGDNILKKVGEKFEELAENIDFNFGEKMKKMRTTTMGKIQDISLQVKSAHDKLKSLKKRRKWYKNLF